MANGGAEKRFGALLQRLAAGGDPAPEYERLRNRLLVFFRQRFPADAEALADEALDRLARRLEDGTPVDSVAGYALGIARFLLMETAARHRKEGDAARGALQELELRSGDTEPDPVLVALQSCLQSIGADSARLILDYYVADNDGLRIERRQRLAKHAGISLNALRNRTLRIRMALEKCVAGRLALRKTEICRDVMANTDTVTMMNFGGRDDVRD